MIRPGSFKYNDQTAVNNSFQTLDDLGRSEDLNKIVLEEFDNFVLQLKSKGINVIVMHDTPTPEKPDAIFPNNWVSFHQSGTVLTYPMFSPNRRIERREDIIDALALLFDVQNRYSLESFEESNQFLEGTGSMILDRVNRVVYACLSPRTDIFLLDRFCLLMDYSLVHFHAYDEHQQPVYHTNVILTVADDYAVLCLECITDLDERNKVVQSLQAHGKEIIDISFDQVKHFAGNMLQVGDSANNKYLVMSEQAYQSLSKDQIDQIESYNPIIHIPVPTIEKYGGGSVRCMMAEVFLPKK